MDQRTTKILFPLLRSAICGTKLTEDERRMYSSEILQELLKLSARHDISHLVVLGLKKNDLISRENAGIEQSIFKAAYRYERMQYEYNNICNALETAEIPFLPLKGSVLRNYYPETWMRTSCDIDILVHHEDLERAISYLMDNMNYVLKKRSIHDVSLFSPIGIHLELHFDLVEEWRANNAPRILRSVWENVQLHENSSCWYEMNDAFFYFYHIAHMAKHFEDGGCGIRPFIDLWILDHMENVDQSARTDLLSQGGLLKFAQVCHALNEVWFGNAEHDEMTIRMQNFLLHGGAYGSADNRVALQQKNKGGRIGYIWSRIFVSREKLQRYYPVLVRHPWLLPVMQIRRWFLIFRPDIAKATKKELVTNANLDTSKADEMNDLLNDVGLG